MGNVRVVPTRRPGKRVRGGKRARVSVERCDSGNAVDWRVWVPMKNMTKAEKKRASKRTIAACSLGTRKSAVASTRRTKAICGPKAVTRRVPSGRAVAWMKYHPGAPPQVNPELWTEEEWDMYRRMIAADKRRAAPKKKKAKKKANPRAVTIGGVRVGGKK